VKPAAKVKPMKFPDTLGACVDLAYQAREKRLKRSREVEAELEVLKAQETAINDHIINSFKKSDIEGAKGKLATASIDTLVVADVQDWEKVFSWVTKTKSWDMLTHKLNDKAYRARLEAGEKVPGVVKFNKVKLYLNKR